MIDFPGGVAGAAAVVPVLAGAALARWRPARGLAAMAIPLAVLVGMTMLLGTILASPRQLAERLPMLALLLCLLAALGLLARPRWLAWLWLASASLVAGWWMAGGALVTADLIRALPLAAGLAAMAACVGAAMTRPWQGALLPCGLAVLMRLAAPPGAWADAALVPALVGLAALAFGRVLPVPGWLALGPMLAALAAGPMVALGRTPDIAVLALLLAAALVGLGWAGWRARAAQAALFAAGAAVLILTG